jgi:hypothetical protein
MAIHPAIRHDDTPGEIGFLTATDRAGGIDIALNAVAVPNVHRAPFAELSLLMTATRSRRTREHTYLPANAVVRHVAAPGSDVILTLSTPGAHLSSRPGDDRRAVDENNIW